MKTVKYSLATTVSFFAASTALATCDFPWYPEYADVFSKYDMVTPIMAKKVAMNSESIQFNPKGSIVGEPVLIRNSKGCPRGYMVATYHGSNREDVDKWNELANILNTGKEIDAAVMAEKVAYLYNTEKVYEFSEVDVNAFTWKSPIYGGSNSIPKVLVGYAIVYEEARRRAGTAKLFFTGIIGTHMHQFQIFKFRTSDSKKITLKFSRNEQAEDYNADDFADKTKDALEAEYNAIKSDATKANANKIKWEEINKKYMGNSGVEDGYPEVN